MKEKYPYDSHFKKPIGVGNLNFENPALRPLLDAYTRAIEKRTALYEPPRMVNKRRIFVPSAAGDIPCYLLEPSNDHHLLPGLLYLHGGGFLFPILHSRLANAMYYAMTLGCRVIMPEYRLAWEHPFPCAFEDCTAVYEWLLRNTGYLSIDENKLLIMGDSAGGCLAAGVTLYARDRGISRLKGQLLIYPVTDDRRSDETLRQYKDAAWTASSNRHMWNLYTANGFFDLRQYAVPYSNPNLSGLPPAYIEPQEMDCLRRQALDYADRLRESGVPTEVKVIPGSYHGFDVDMKNKVVLRILLDRCRVMQAMLDGGFVREHGGGH